MPLPHQLANGTRAVPSAEPKLLSFRTSNLRNRIRYYLLFLVAIPIKRVRHPRVTHQSATLGLVQALILPFDLHA